MKSKLKIFCPMIFPLLLFCAVLCGCSNFFHGMIPGSDNSIKSLKLFKGEDDATIKTDISIEEKKATVYVKSEYGTTSLLPKLDVAYKTSVIPLTQKYLVKAFPGMTDTDAILALANLLLADDMASWTIDFLKAHPDFNVPPLDMPVNFSSPVFFLLVAADGSPALYTVSAVSVNDISNLTASVGDGRVTLSWQNPVGMPFSKILISCDADSVSDLVLDYSEDATGTATFTGLENGKEYTFKVRIDFDDGIYGQELSVGATPYIEPIKNLVASSGDGFVALSWTNPSDNDFDYVEISAEPGAYNAKIYRTDSPNNSHIVTPLENKTKYTFTLKTFYKSGNCTEPCNVNCTPHEMTVEMVDVVTLPVTIAGKNNANNYSGVFVSGRNVTLSPFEMSKYEVTQELYEAYMTGKTVDGSPLEAKPSYCKETGSYPLVAGETQKYRPVENVTWYDAVYFCNALTEKTFRPDEKVYTITDIAVSSGHITSATVTMDRTKTGYRLPTEAEWEFAARGGDTSEPDWNYTFSGHATADGVSYSASKNAGLDSVGWYWYNTGNGGVTGNSEPSSGTPGYGTHEVGKKAHNRLGLYDMSGNVWEWCWDRTASVGEGNVTDPAGPASGSYRVVRGGGWSSLAYDSSVCYRYYNGPSNRSYSLGFRVVRSRSE